MKKIVIMLLVLLILAIAIGTSPLIDWIHANAAEADSSTALIAGEETSLAVAETTEGLAYAPGSRQTAITVAMIIAGGTLILSVIVFIRKHDPNK